MALSGSNIIESIYTDRVLVIESDEKMRSVYEEHLDFSGFEVYCALDLAQAENHLEYLPVNLIVCNEDISGLESTLKFISGLRQKNVNNTIIVLTKDEDRLWDNIPDSETSIQSFPIPHDLENFLKADINQFVSLVLMAVDNMKCVLLVNDSPIETAELENMLINNYFRVCSVRDGLQALEAIDKAAPTSHKVQILVLNIINRYYPGLMFLSRLAKQSINLPSIILTGMQISEEKIKQKTNYDISSIILKKNISSELIPAIQKLI